MDNAVSYHRHTAPAPKSGCQLGDQNGSNGSSVYDPDNHWSVVATMCGMPIHETVDEIFAWAKGDPEKLKIVDHAFAIARALRLRLKLQGQLAVLQYLRSRVTPSALSTIDGQIEEITEELKWATVPPEWRGKR